MLCDILLTGTHISAECLCTLHQTQKVCPKHFFGGIKRLKDTLVVFFDVGVIRSGVCVHACARVMCDDCSVHTNS